MSETPRIGELLKEHWNLARSLRRLEIVFNPERCVGLYECYEVCPVNCWEINPEQGKVIYAGAERCIACNACVLQCSVKAIELKVV